MNKPKIHHWGTGAEALRQARLLRKSSKLNTRMLLHVNSKGADYYTNFGKLAKELNLTKLQVRRCLRHLDRNGLTKFTRGLFFEDGNIAGSGYTLTNLGKVVAEILNDSRKEPATTIPEECGSQNNPDSD